MRTFATCALGVMLIAFSIICSPLGGATLAGSQTNAAMRTATSTVSHGWRVSDAVRYERLAVFPVTSDEVADADEFITLDEGLRAGTVTVTELGSEGRTRPPVARQHNGRIAQQRVDGAQVNKLAITNKSGKKLVLIAGEMVVGGKQDRIVGHDCIISSSDTPVPLDVFCVEHGRWSGGAAFADNQASAGRADGGAKMMASPKVREKAQAKKDQGLVWEAVAKSVSENQVATSTGDLKSVYQDKRVGSTLEGYERAFKDKLKGANVVGVVVAIGGKVISADVFASPRLFQAYWPKMLRSYALEAMTAAAVERGEADAKAAEAFLARAEGNQSSAGQEGLYRLHENQSDKDASFELESVAIESKRLVHFNRVNKK
jgi:hypothetical protein